MVLVPLDLALRLDTSSMVGGFGDFFRNIFGTKRNNTAVNIIQVNKEYDPKTDQGVKNIITRSEKTDQWKKCHPEETPKKKG